MKKISYLIVLLLLLYQGRVFGTDFPYTFTDSSGAEITFLSPPQRVVSLVPSVTEMLFQLGAGDVVAGITYHSILPAESAGKKIIGGFFKPDLNRIAALEPDVIFYAGLQKEVKMRFEDEAVLINLMPTSIKESFDHLRLLGEVFDKRAGAERIIKRQQEQLDTIRRKVAFIAPENRMRVMRLMGRTSVMTPGDDSFQNDFIRAAGAVPPILGKKGPVVSVTLQEWQQFNPQVLYGCGGDRSVLELLKGPEWKEVDAVRNNRVYFFPCDLTCRAATHTGYFVSWLAARIYHDAFSDEGNFVLPQQVVEITDLDLGLEYVGKAQLLEADIKDFRNRTLAVTFKEPMSIVSTLEGERQNILTVANHYFPPPSWGLGHNQGIDGLRRDTLKVLDLSPDSTSILFTGANMKNLAVVKKRFRGLEVTALVTAGVAGNSVRMGRDAGLFYEPGDQEKNKPGTINILLLTNTRLSSRAMTRAIISATEAKTGALQDLDIRSSYTSLSNQATGTGTDNILVVQGKGVDIDSTGGHTRMGELIAAAVHEGVLQAIHKQNGFTASRAVIQRLKERKINLSDLCRKVVSGKQVSRCRAELESILLDPRYAGFLEAVLAVTDDAERSLIEDTSGLDVWFQAVADEIAGVAGVTIEQPEFDTLPPVLAKGLAAVVAGTKVRIMQP